MKRFSWYLLIALLVLGFTLRLWSLHASHWWDETVYLQHAEIVFSGRNNYDEFITRPPLLSLLIAAVFVLYHNAAMASLLVAFLGTLGILGVFLVAKETTTENTALLAAFLYAFIPLVVESANWIMADAPAVTIVMFSFYTLIYAHKTSRSHLYFVSGVIFALAILMRFSVIPLLIIYPLYVLIHRISIVKPAIYTSLGGIITLAPYFIWVRLKYGSFFTTLIKAQAAVSDNVGNLFFYTLNAIDVFSLIVIIGFILSIPLILSKSSKFKERKNEKIMALWVVLFALYLSLVPHKEPRYILPLVAPLCILSAEGLCSFYNRFHDKSLIIIIFLVLALVSFYPSFARLEKPFLDNEITEEVQVSNYILSLNQTSVIYTNHNYPVYAYYTTMKTVRVAQDENFYTQFPQTMPEAGFFIYAKGIDKDPTRTWLDSNSHFIKKREWQNIILYTYSPY